MKELLSSPMWDGISGLVALIGLLVPIVSFLIGRNRRASKGREVQAVGSDDVSSPQPLSSQQVRQTPGCAHFLGQFALNFSVFTFAQILSFAFIAAVGNSGGFRDDWLEMIDSTTSLANWRLSFSIGCLFFFIAGLFMIAAPLISATVGHRRGVFQGLFVNIAITNVFIFCMFSAQAGAYSIEQVDVYLAILFGTLGGYVVALGSVMLTRLAIEGA